MRLLVAFIFISFSVTAQQRIVLIEQFTNSGCPPCAASTPTVLNYVDSNPADVVAIAYHTSFPYTDSMHLENPAEANTRTAYYSVSGVPYTIVDGNYYSNGSPAFVGAMATTINARKAMPAQYNISASSNTITGNVLNTQLTFTSLLAGNANDSLRAFIVVIEKTVLKSSYAASPGANTETTYEYVMRKMLTSDTGTSLQNRGISGADAFTLNWNLANIKDMNEVRIIAFVQNKNTQEVYQATMFTPLVFASADENTAGNSITVFPNPASEVVFIGLSNGHATGRIELTDLSGRVLFSREMTNSTMEIPVSEYSKGMYFINYISDGLKTTKKMILK